MEAMKLSMNPMDKLHQTHFVITLFHLKFNFSITNLGKYCYDSMEPATTLSVKLYHP